MNLTYTIKLYYSGAECTHRYLHTREAGDPSSLPRLAQQLVLEARAQGWLQDENAIFCPQCVRELRPLPGSVREAKTNDGRVGGSR